jgi:peptide deformylase
LTRKSDPVPDVLRPEFQQFLDDLIQSGEENMGVGIAAPQVGNNLRAFILALKPSPRYPHSPTLEPTAIVNPEILQTFGPVGKDWEGCLSVPGYRGLVPRPNGIRVRYLDRFGATQEATLEGFIARVFQHEFDHLEGILYPDRMDKEDRLLDLDEFFAVTGVLVPK